MVAWKLDLRRCMKKEIARGKHKTARRQKMGHVGGLTLLETMGYVEPPEIEMEREE